ncbi:hypothetical protein ABVT39_018347 [Epinephelus coioides]
MKLAQTMELPPVVASEISNIASATLTLCACIAVSQARITAWQTMIHRNLWLQQSSISEASRKDLLKAPISPDRLFVPRFHTMVDTMKSALEETENIRRHVAWNQPAARSALLRSMAGPPWTA